MDMIQDWMIINKIKMGDPDAWDILVHKYYDSVYFYCVRRCYGDCDIASDLTQDIFLKLVESLPRYRFIGKFQNYLYTMAVNTCNNYLKKRHIEQIELTDNFTTDLDTCIILFSLITIWRKQLHNYFLWCISGSICVAVILIANIFKIYEIRMLYWGIAYFITTTILGIILYSQTKIIKWEVASVWN